MIKIFLIISILMFLISFRIFAHIVKNMEIVIDAHN